MRINQLIDEMSATLATGGRPSARVEAEILLMESYRATIGRSLRRSELAARMEDELPQQAVEQFRSQARRRAEGEPLQYVMGWQAFLDHDYRVGPGVLVPRPETEGLVLHAIESIGRRPGALTGIEIGTGSGAIAIELVSRRRDLTIVASEASREAMTYAETNARVILGYEGGKRLTFVSARPEQIWEPFAGAKVDFVVSNPPYLADEGECESDVLQFEPRMALFAGGADPDRFYVEIARGAPERLKQGGQVFLEIPHERAERIRSYFSSPAWCVEIHRDLSQRPRILHATLLN